MALPSRILGGQEGRWSSRTMTDYANPRGAWNQSGRWERNAAHLRISLRRGVLAKRPPLGRNDIRAAPSP